MDDKYTAWISEHYPTYESAYGKCAEATTAMLAVFPELHRVRGHYYCLVWGERSHWWLVTADGGIVDPTAVQFPSRGTGVYEAWNEGSAEPTGKCPNCGGYAYNHAAVCSDACAREYERYLMHG